MKRYRYITCGLVHMDDPVHMFRLIAGTNLNGCESAIRIELPDDMKLNKWSCDPYSLTQDTRTISQLHPVAMVRINGRLRPWSDDLLQIKPADWYLELQRQDYRLTIRGYTPR